MANTAPNHSGNDQLDDQPQKKEGDDKHDVVFQPHLPKAAEEVTRQVEEEKEPRWHALTKGRFILTIYVLVLAAVVGLALAARAFSVLPGDVFFTLELQEITNPVAYNVLFYVSYIGYPVLSAVIFALVVLAFLAVRLWLEAIFLVLTLIADAIGGVLKMVVGRHRPLPSQVHVVQAITSPSFPSGHTLHYTVFYGFIAFVLFTAFRPSWPRNVLIGVCLALIVLVGPSRIYLGEHWLSDVVGGYLIGALFLVPLIAAYLWAKQRFSGVGART